MAFHDNKIVSDVLFVRNDSNTDAPYPPFSKSSQMPMLKRLQEFLLQLGGHMKFQVGDKVVYPAHGVAEIVGIEDQSIQGHEHSFYVLSILESQARVMIPIKNVDRVGLRPLVSDEEANEVFTILKKREKIVDSTPWNRRYRDYMEKIRTGSIFEVAKVLRDLYVLRGDKELSFGERKLLDTAHSLLVSEISLSKGITQQEVAVQFQSIFKN